MKKALIVIDMQNDFITGSLANPSAEAIVKPIAEKIASFDGTVIATRDSHDKNYLETSEGKALPVIHCVIGTEGWKIETNIADAILKKEDRLILNKATFGTFEWNLSDYDSVEIVGTCTDICVVTNALIIKTMYPDCRVTVFSSLCAGLTPEKHLAALETMRSCQIIVE